jgi:hypothetical protein
VLPRERVCQSTSQSSGQIDRRASRAFSSIGELYAVRVTLCASPEAQARALMEASCDVNVLARQFVGLAPWV